MNNNISERLRNSDYSKVIRLLNSKDPRYCFGIISACRGLPTENLRPTQSEVDHQNHINRINSETLGHELNANYLPFMEVVGNYPEENNGLVEEISYLVYVTQDKEAKMKKILIELAKVFEQDSILIIEAKDHIAQYIWTGKGDAPAWIRELNKKRQHLDFNQNSLDKIFTRVGTKLHGRRFQLKEVRRSNFANNISTRILYYNNPMILDYARIENPQYLERFEEAIKDYIL